jgi:hypothetical protein
MVQNFANRGTSPPLRVHRRSNTIEDMSDTSATGEKNVLSHIDELLAEEKALRAAHLGQGLTGTDRDRLQQIEVQLDQAWDLLRQRRALAEFGASPEAAHERPGGEVEGYLQ